MVSRPFFERLSLIDGGPPDDHLQGAAIGGGGPDMAEAGGQLGLGEVSGSGGGFKVSAH